MSNKETVNDKITRLEHERQHLGDENDRLCQENRKLLDFVEGLATLKPDMEQAERYLKETIEESLELLEEIGRTEFIEMWVNKSEQPRDH